MKIIRRSVLQTLFCAALSLQGLASTPLHAAEMVVTSEIPLVVNPSPYIVEFVETVTKRTNGAIQGKYFHAASLYNDRDAIAALGTGAVQIVFPVMSRLEQMDARVGVASLPFSLSSAKMLNKCFADGYTQMLSSFIEPKGAKILGILRTADLMFLMRNRDIQKLEDLKGQKIRVISGGIVLDTIKSVGASPVALPAPELSPAISQGVIDGMITSPAGWADVVGITAKFATLVPGMSLATSAVVVDKKWFDGLPAAQRQTIQDVIDEIIKRQWTETVAKDETLIKRMTDLGGSYRIMAPAEVDRLKERFAAAGANFRKQHAETINKAEALEKTCKVS